MKRLRKKLWCINVHKCSYLFIKVQSISFFTVVFCFINNPDPEIRADFAPIRVLFLTFVSLLRILSFLEYHKQDQKHVFKWYSKKFKRTRKFSKRLNSNKFSFRLNSENSIEEKTRIRPKFNI